MRLLSILKSGGMSKGDIMKRKVLFAFLFVPVLLFAEFAGTSGIIDIPTAIFGEPGSLTFTLRSGVGLKSITPGDISYATESLPDYQRFDIDFNLRYSLNTPVPIEIALSAYTLSEYVMDISVGLSSAFPLAVGVSNITYKDNVSSVDGGYVDEALYEDDRASEWFSLFFVATKDFGSMGQYTVGMGRGRFIGIGPKSQYFNTAYLLSTNPDVSMGLFFGGEIPVVKDVLWLLGDFDGRDVNVGARFKSGAFEFDAALTHAEQMLPDYPASPLFDVAFSYTLDINAAPKTGKLIISCYDIDTRKKLNAELIILSPERKVYKIVNGKLEMDLPSDKYQVEVKSDNYISMKKVISVVAGGSGNYKFPLKKMVEKTEFNANTPQAKLYREAMLYYKRGDVINAINKMNKCIKMESNNSTYNNFLKELYKKRNEEIIYHKKAAKGFEAKGMKTRAKSEWKAVLKLNPKDYEAKKALKRLTAKKTTTKKTVKKKSTKTATQWYNEGLNYYKKGKYKSAIKCFKEALKLDSTNKKAKKYLKKAENRLKAG